MNNKSKKYPNPRFSSIEEEDKYWETHSPLDEGFEGEVETSEQKRSSFLSVRMTGDELSQLRDTAAQIGLGPSTYARLVLTNVISPPSGATQYPSGCPAISIGKHEGDLSGTGSTGASGIWLVNTDDISINPDVANSILSLICSAWKGRIVTPDDTDYEKIERLVRIQL